MNLNTTYINTVPHSEINNYQQKADLLLLVIPNVPDAKGILTGKLFEYIATGNRIVNLGPKDGDAARILKDCQIRETFTRTQKSEIQEYVSLAYQAFTKNELPIINSKHKDTFSRAYQARQIKQLIS